MADIKILAPFILAWEGGYVESPTENGGAAKHGVSLSLWKAHGYDKNGDGKIDKHDLKLIDERDTINRILKPLFWDKCKADMIVDQSVANIIVDWVYNSGFSAIKKVQTLIGVASDGVVGQKTIDAINSKDPKKLFEDIWNLREKHYKSLSNFSKYGKGWMNRLNGIKYGSLTFNNGNKKSF